MLLVSVALLGACSNSYEPNMNEANQTQSGVQVVNINDYRATTRGGQDSYSVLKFRDQEQCDSLCSELQEMSEEEKEAYFEKIGFEGSFSLMQKAEKEVDDIFEEAYEGKLDSIQMAEKIDAYKEKYAGIFDFSREGDEDCTPQYRFSDQKAQLLGATRGEVVIGEKVVMPQYVTLEIPYTGEFICYEKSEVKLKGRSNYNSYFHLGKVGRTLFFKVVTYKQKFAHKVFDKECLHTGHLKVVGSKYTLDSPFTTPGAYCNTQIPLEVMSPYMNLELTDFSCERYPDLKISKTINNILAN